MRPLALFALCLPLLAQRVAPPPVKPAPDETARVQSKTGELEAMVRSLRAAHTDPDLLADVDVFAKAGRMLLEFPDEYFTQDGIDHALTVLDTGLERARQLQNGHSPWMSGRRREHGYYSAVDGSVQPYGVQLPEGYDGSRPVRLYVWMHGRSQNLTEANFLYQHPSQGPGKPPVADAGQMQLDVYGRWNGAGYHFAGEADVFEALHAVQKRYKIDPDRILLRGFSMGGEGAWHIALHHPDRWAAAEIGAGTVSKRLQQTPDLKQYQILTLRIWENIPEWALNVFNMPLAGHDGETDGQLESSVRAREQLAKEGFKVDGDPYELYAHGTPAIFLVSKKTGHGTSPEVRQRLDSFLKEHGDRGRTSPDHIRFLTYTTRYNRDYWVTLDRLERHYERAEIDATRGDGGERYRIATKNLTRLVLRETGHAAEIEIDGQKLRVKPAAEIALEKSGKGWRPSSAAPAGIHKIHGLQGPVDDAFLDPFLCVRPTGTPWNDAVNQQALRTLARFDRLYAKFLRAHPRIVDDKDVTEADFAKYHVVLFGDPGSNRWIAKLNGKLPLRWTKQSVTLGHEQFAAADCFPALIYPSPLAPSRYLVLNTGLTIDDRGYRGDYGMPQIGDFAVMKVKEGGDLGEPLMAGLFDENWEPRK